MNAAARLGHNEERTAARIPPAWRGEIPVQEPVGDGPRNLDHYCLTIDPTDMVKLADYLRERGVTVVSEGPAQRAGAGIQFPGDLHGPAEYRKHLARVFTARALEQAVRRSRG
jgi:hypothetical protein